MLPISKVRTQETEREDLLKVRPSAHATVSCCDFDDTATTTQQNMHSKTCTRLGRTATKPHFHLPTTSASLCKPNLNNKFT